MRYSSQLFLHTDGSLGKWPLIETDENNVITSITEYSNGIPEMGHHFFESGLIVCSLWVLPECSMGAPRVLNVHSDTKDDFIFLMKKAFKLDASESHTSLIGKRANIYHISGFDLNTFHAESVIVRQLV